MHISYSLSHRPRRVKLTVELTRHEQTLPADWTRRGVKKCSPSASPWVASVPHFLPDQLPAAPRLAENPVLGIWTPHRVGGCAVSAHGHHTCYSFIFVTGSFANLESSFRGPFSFRGPLDHTTLGIRARAHLLSQSSQFSQPWIFDPRYPDLSWPKHLLMRNAAFSELRNMRNAAFSELRNMRNAAFSELREEL